MAKVILLVGALASALLGFALWRSVERREFPTSGEWARIMNGSGEPGALQIVGAWEDRDDVRHLLEMAPPKVWSFMREGDEVRVRTRFLSLPRFGFALSQLQWMVRREGDTFHFGDPPAWRFWGLLGGIAAAPFVLSALAAGAVALASGRKKP